jgi:hypothetical protein
MTTLLFRKVVIMSEKLYFAFGLLPLVKFAWNDLFTSF